MYSDTETIETPAKPKFAYKDLSPLENVAFRVFCELMDDPEPEREAILKETLAELHARLDIDRGTSNGKLAAARALGQG